MNRSVLFVAGPANQYHYAFAPEAAADLLEQVGYRACDDPGRYVLPSDLTAEEREQRRRDAYAALDAAGFHVTYAFAGDDRITAAIGSRPQQGVEAFVQWSAAVVRQLPGVWTCEVRSGLDAAFLDELKDRFWVGSSADAARALWLRKEVTFFHRVDDELFAALGGVNGHTLVAIRNDQVLTGAPFATRTGPLPMRVALDPAQAARTVRDLFLPSVRTAREGYRSAARRHVEAAAPSQHLPADYGQDQTLRVHVDSTTPEWIRRGLSSIGFRMVATTTYATFALDHAKACEALGALRDLGIPLPSVPSPIVSGPTDRAPTLGVSLAKPRPPTPPHSSGGPQPGR